MPLRIAPHVQLADSDADLVLLDERGGRFWQLNGTGASTVRRLLAGQDASAAAHALAAEFSIELPRAQADVDRLLGQLRDAGLVVAS